MLPRLLIAVAVTAITASPLFAQDSAPIQRWPTRDSAPAASQPAPAPAPAPPQRVAVPRQPSPPPVAAAPTPQPSPPPERVAEQRRTPPPDGAGERVAVPRRGPAPSARDRDRDRRDRDRGRTNVYIAPRPLPYGYYSYRRDYYPYGYGAFGGLGYFYYDPFTWSGRAPIYAYPGGAYGRGYYGRGYNYDIGEVRLRVTPRDAQVFVDGYFAGEVDNYDGILQGLRLESGPYHIEVRAPGYETAQFDIRINPGQKITYRADLRRLP